MSKYSGYEIVTKEDAFRESEHYLFLLGIFLGDGYLEDYSKRLKKFSSTKLLSIACDARYPKVINQIGHSLYKILPEIQLIKIKLHQKHKNCVYILVSNRGFYNIFPKYEGKKHENKITLEGWQEDLIKQNPDLFLKGLFWSDGCRKIKRINKSGEKVYHYTFQNESLDILNMCKEALEIRKIDSFSFMPKIGRIEVSSRNFVKELDSFIGPKT